MKRKWWSAWIGLIFCFLTGGFVACGEVGETSSVHTHSYGEWVKDEKSDTHTKVCECGDKVSETCVGGVVTCTEQAVCEICNSAYGELDTDNHSSEELKYAPLNDDVHKIVYTCCNGIRVAEEEHRFVDEICVDCEYEKGYILITNVEELREVYMDLSLKYRLANDIDLGGEDWTPIGTEDDGPFTGKFDGNGFKIFNFQIIVDRRFNGFFGFSEGEIKNIGVTDFTIECGDGRSSLAVGGLVGYSAGIIKNCYAIGYIDAGERISEAGGLVGIADNVIENCYAAVDVVHNGWGANVGGLVGLGVNIVNCYASGNVIVDCTSTSEHDHSCIGGLAGRAVTVRDCYATGSVGGTSIGGNSNVGGLLGECVESVIDCYATGEVFGMSARYCMVGGLVGYRGRIQGSYATGNVKNENSLYAYIGGLVGYGTTVEYCWASGNVKSQNSTNVSIGGLVGYKEKGSISNSYATGTLVSNELGSSYVGGLIGRENIFDISNETVVNCYATGNVSSKSSYVDIGGLVGASNGKIKNCYAIGTVVGNAIKRSCAGGLVGSNGGEIINSYATGDVTSSSTEDYSSPTIVGGLVGYWNKTEDITNCYRNGTQKIILQGIRTELCTEGVEKPLEDIQSVEFHSEILQWSEERWLFIKGAFPLLK